jgi:hypothetical protein
MLAPFASDLSSSKGVDASAAGSSAASPNRSAGAARASSAALPGTRPAFSTSFFQTGRRSASAARVRRAA